MGALLMGLTFELYSCGLQLKATGLAPEWKTKDVSVM